MHVYFAYEIPTQKVLDIYGYSVSLQKKNGFLSLFSVSYLRNREKKNRMVGMMP